MVKNPSTNAEYMGSIPESERSPGGENGNSFQYSCPENPLDRGAWRATYSLWSHKESDTTEQPNNHLLLSDRRFRITVT